jgi:diguanylate cyclase (GGDEF)-like protein/PAS domain S-box-containing protein
MRGSIPESDDPVVQCALRDPLLHKQLLGQLDKGVCIVNRDYRILYWNVAAERISGYLSHEVAGQANHGDLLLHCANYDALLGGQGCALTELVLAGKPQDSIVLLLHREGYRILAYVESRPIHDAEGATIGALEMFEEVMASPQRGVREFEAFGCSDSFLRAAHRKYGEMKALHALEALNVFEIPFGWLRVDLDGAQDLDRNFGHGMVDAAVKMVAAALDRNLGALDVLTRWEGHEFRVQISRCTHSELAAAAERLCLLVRASSVDWWGDRRRVTVSVGGATAEPGDTLESLDARVSDVFDGCRASGGDRAAVAHINKGGTAGRC